MPSSLKVLACSAKKRKNDHYFLFFKGLIKNNSKSCNNEIYDKQKQETNRERKLENECYKTGYHHGEIKSHILNYNQFQIPYKVDY